MFSETKYIVFERPGGQQLMVLFDSMIGHSDIHATFISNTQYVFKAISAGFVDPRTGECYGKSVSIKLESNPKRDSIIAKQLLKLK